MTRGRIYDITTFPLLSPVICCRPFTCCRASCCRRPSSQLDRARYNVSECLRTSSRCCSRYVPLASRGPRGPSSPTCAVTRPSPRRHHGQVREAFLLPASYLPVPAAIQLFASARHARLLLKGPVPSPPASLLSRRWFLKHLCGLLGFLDLRPLRPPKRPKRRRP